MVAVTDSRQVRREKISERMKLLQDLVPGCSKVNIDENWSKFGRNTHLSHVEDNSQRLFMKVTGKAVMLDEIINYVQSLQRQVEVRMISSASDIADSFERTYKFFRI